MLDEAWGAMHLAPHGDAGGDCSRSLVYTTKGIFEVPPNLIVRDLNNPIYVSQRDWRRLRSEHKQMSAAAILKGCHLGVSSIVVMSTDGASPRPRCRNVVWMVRFSISSGSHLYGPTFGDSYLFQLPRSLCAKVAQQMNKYEEENQVPLQHQSRLLTDLTATMHDFDPASWPECKQVDRLCDFSDSVFALSVAPCETPTPSFFESEDLFPTRFVRPLGVRPLPGAAPTVEWHALPDDVQNYTIGTLFERFACNSSTRDWRVFLCMRAVNREWRSECDSCATTLLAQITDQVVEALRSGRVHQLVAARKRVLRVGISTMQLLLDSKDPNVFSLMRLRTQKRPGCMPPSAADAPVPKRVKRTLPFKQLDLQLRGRTGGRRLR